MAYGFIGAESRIIMWSYDNFDMANAEFDNPELIEAKYQGELSDFKIVNHKAFFSPTRERQIQLEENALQMKKKNDREQMLNQLPEDLSAIDEALCALYEITLGGDN